MKKEKNLLMFAPLLFLLVFMISCKDQSNYNASENTISELNKSNILQSTSLENTKTDARIDKTKSIYNPYQLQVNMDENDKNSFTINVLLKMDDGCYISSHFASGMKGRFQVIMDENSFLTMDKVIIEEPKYKMELFKWSEDSVKIVRQNTTYRQDVKLLSQEDFEVKGTIQFVIEPKCTMERNTFVISRRNGKMKVLLVC